MPHPWKFRLPKNKMYEENNVLPAVQELMRQGMHGSRDLPLVSIWSRKTRTWAPWLGSLVGEGSQGVVFRTKSNQEIWKLQQSARFSVGTFPPAGVDIAIKVSRAPRGSEADEDCVREAVLSHRLSQLPCFDVPKCRYQLCLQQYTPQFYWAGNVGNRGKGRPYLITIMGYAGEKTVERLYWDRKLTAVDYVNIERAICSLWWAGLAHADFHAGNIMLGKRGPYIIDFGLAQKLPAAVRDAVRGNIVNAIQSNVKSLAVVWFAPSEKHNSTPYANERVEAGRKDAFDLLELYKSVKNRGSIPDVRRRVWGFTG